MFSNNRFVIALVNPKMGTKIETVKRKELILFCTDVLLLAEDIAPSRLLEKSKQLVSQLSTN
jgi:Ca-activated chloride channel family protein